MSTIEDFENAPVGATATHDSGSRALKTDKVGESWILQNESYLSDEGMVFWNYTLDQPAPATAREALDLAWELAYPVKEGQVIPKGTHILRLVGGQVRVFQNIWGLDEIAPFELPYFRTLEPLPDPEPDWVDALVVLARLVKAEPDSPPSLWANLGGGMWGNVETTKRAEVWDLRDVTPLYPKGQDA